MALSSVGSWWRPCETRCWRWCRWRGWQRCSGSPARWRRCTVRARCSSCDSGPSARGWGRREASKWWTRLGEETQTESRLEAGAREKRKEELTNQSHAAFVVPSWGCCDLIHWMLQGSKYFPTLTCRLFPVNAVSVKCTKLTALQLFFHWGCSKKPFPAQEARTEEPE